jgi:DNA mismatch repair protein MutS2
MTEHDTNNTLYLIDEICTGTDPLEGVSLSKAILLHLVKNDNRIICTTHYSELVNFVKSYNLGSLARVDFDIESLSPLYSITFGISGKSQGINISKRLGLSKELTNSALKFLKKESSEEEKLANFLTFEKDRLMKLNNSLELKLEEQKKEDERLEKLSETIRLNEIKIKQDLEKENEIKISSVLNELEVLLEKVKNNNKESYSNLKGEVNKLTKKIELNDKIITEEIKVGDTVLINYINQYGKVINIRNNKYEVEYDSFTTTFKLSDITLVNNPVIKEVNYKPKKFKNIEQTEYTPKFIGKSITTCDLRGVRYNEVNEILSSHLYELIELGMHSLRIIHGYGSGAVKQAVYEFINNEMSIKRSELGGKQESQGVTIIYF